MKRTIRFLSFITFGILIASIPLKVLATTFTDVTINHFSYEAIELLYKMKVIKGYGDGTFRPENPVTRVEALKIIMEGAKLAVPEISSDDMAGFTDVTQGGGGI